MLVSTLALACLLCGVGAAQICQAADGAPAFEVDASWMKPLPNGWAIGQVSGMAIGPQDHVWIIHRPATVNKVEQSATANPASAACCIPAPPVIEFDASGKLVRAWGGPGQGYEWPLNEHGLFIDYKGNVWIAGNGRGTPPGASTKGGRGTPRAPIPEGQTDMTGYFYDNMILKFTQDGKFLMQIGKPAHTRGSNDIENLRLPAKATVSAPAPFIVGRSTDG